jgi:phosphoribosylanthranilate isomerase
MKAKLKICGMKEPANILEVARLEPDYLGFIFYKGSKRYVDGLTPAFVKDLPSSIKRVGVFVNEDLTKVAELAELYGLDAVQLHGEESAVYCVELQNLLAQNGTQLIKAFGIDEEFNFALLEVYENTVDFFLFDTKTPQHGGSGRTFQWSVLANYKLDKPYFLSGGIGNEHVSDLQQVGDPRLFAIDVNSKFELAPGIKDIEKLNDFKKRL